MIFRKIVSNLAFSPTLIRELSQYNDKLRHQRKLYSIALVFIFLTLVITLFASLLPRPRTTNGSQSPNLAQASFTSADELKQAVDNSASLFYVYDHFGATIKTLNPVADKDLPTDWQNYLVVDRDLDTPAKGYIFYKDEPLAIRTIDLQSIKNTTLLKSQDSPAILIDQKTGNIIISNDSLQFYDYLPLATAKVSLMNITKNQAANESQLEPNERLKISFEDINIASQPSLLLVSIANWPQTNIDLINPDQFRLADFNNRLIAYKQLFPNESLADAELILQTSSATANNHCSIHLLANSQTTTTPLSCNLTTRIAGALDSEFTDSSHNYFVVSLLILTVLLIAVLTILRITELFDREIKDIRHNINRGNLWCQKNNITSSASFCRIKNQAAH